MEDPIERSPVVGCLNSLVSFVDGIQPIWKDKDDKDDMLTTPPPCPIALGLGFSWPLGMTTRCKKPVGERNYEIET